MNRSSYRSYTFSQGKVADIGLNSRLAVNSLTSCRETFPHNVSQVSVGSDRSIKVVVLSSGIHIFISNYVVTAQFLCLIEYNLAKNNHRNSGSCSWGWLPVDLSRIIYIFPIVSFTIGFLVIKDVSLNVIALKFSEISFCQGAHEGPIRAVDLQETRFWWNSWTPEI